MASLAVFECQQLQPILKQIFESSGTYKCKGHLYDIKKEKLIKMLDLKRFRCQH